jgi:hypothetical protein
MVRDPLVSLPKDCIDLKSQPDEEAFDKWRSAIGACGVALCSGIPVCQSFYFALARGTPMLRSFNLETGMDFLARGLETKYTEVSDDSRISFWKAFGVLPDVQIAVEIHYQQTTLEYKPVVRDVTDFIGTPNLLM